MSVGGLSLCRYAPWVAGGHINFGPSTFSDVLLDWNTGLVGKSPQPSESTESTESTELWELRNLGRGVIARLAGVRGKLQPMPWDDRAGDTRRRSRTPNVHDRQRGDDDQTDLAWRLCAETGAWRILWGNWGANQR